MGKAFIRYWVGLPSVFSDLAAGKPQIEVLDDPGDLDASLAALIDKPIRLAWRLEDGAVIVADSVDSYPENCPAALVPSVEQAAFDNAAKQAGDFLFFSET